MRIYFFSIRTLNSIYWCEASYNETSRMHIFIVDKWRAENEGNKYYHSILDTNGNRPWTRVYEDSDIDIDLIKKRFLESAIFDGKSFWQVESEIAWLDESSPVEEQLG